MTRISFSLISGACLFLMAVALMIPAGAVELEPAGSTTNTVTIANGDPVYIHGIATGQPRLGLQLWIISHNYLKVTTLPVNDDDTYVYELRGTDTLNLASGQYFFLVQHPMMNGQFDVIYDRSAGTIINRPLGKEIFKLSGAGSLQGPDSAQALVDAIGSQNIDDTFATYSFFVSPPAAFINPVGDRYVGDKFTISGSTNLAVGDKLMVEVVSSSFRPTEKTESGEFSGASGEVTIVPGSNGYNHWSFDIDASAFRPDEYIVRVSAVIQDVTASTYFNIINRPPTTTATNTPPVTTTTQRTTTPVWSPPLTTPRSPLPVPLVAGALALVIIITRMGKRD